MKPFLDPNPKSHDISVIQFVGRECNSEEKKVIHDTISNFDFDISRVEPDSKDPLFVFHGCEVFTTCTLNFQIFWKIKLIGFYVNT